MIRTPNTFAQAEAVMESQEITAGDSCGDLRFGRSGVPLNKGASLILVRTGKRRRRSDGKFELSDIAIRDTRDNTNVTIFVKPQH